MAATNDELVDRITEMHRATVREVLQQFADSCEQQAVLADSLAAEAIDGSAHSPEWFLGWKSAMESIAVVARQIANGRTLGSPRVTPLENVVQLRGDR